MIMMTPDDYFAEKMKMLSELLSYSEEIMSSINTDQWENYKPIGEKRQEVIEKLNAFEEAYRFSCDPGLTPEQKSEINMQVDLILNFDQDVISRLEQEKLSVIKAMNSHKQERSIVDGYKKAEVPAAGTFLNSKK